MRMHIGKKKTDLVLVAAAVLIGVFCFGTGLKTSPFPEKMSITILDVGQGNSALVQTIEGKNILVDGGGFSGGTFDVGRYVVAPFLWYKKILSLDAVILTHPEADLYVLENFKIHLVVKKLRLWRKDSPVPGKKNKNLDPSPG